MAKGALLALLLLLSTPTMAVEIPAEIEACMKRNLPASTSMQSIELRARDRGNYEQVMHADVFWKRRGEETSSVMMHFSEPVDIRGARFLIKQQEPQNEMYIYMPGLFKVRRVTSRKISSSVMGTDFSYEDFERLHGVLTDLRLEQFPDDVVSGRPVYVLNSYPDETSGYVKIASYIDKQTCVVLKTELYESGHQLRKLMTIDPAALKKTGDIWYPAELLMKDLREKTETRLLVRNIKTDAILDDSLFDEDKLKQVEIPSLD
jgi:outer membrane lipoprotein-sorting protein